LRKVIREEKPDLISSHLYFASVVARICCPKNIPLIFTIHNQLSLDCYQNSLPRKILEKITYSKRFSILSVSQAVLDDFDKWIGIKGSTYVLQNYVTDEFFEKEYQFSQRRPIRLVTVGNLKKLKNHIFLIEAFKQLDNKLFTLDICGEGISRIQLQKEITDHHLSVSLLGAQDNLSERLKNYDLFVFPSFYEGFGIAVVEAMAIGLPLILSDIDVLKETSEGNALFFNPNKPEELARILNDVSDGKYDLEKMSNKGKQIARKYSQGSYLEKLNTIFETVMSTEKTKAHKI
jgi:glycosyltransferase involved in cell wall biosynthesis